LYKLTPSFVKFRTSPLQYSLSCFSFLLLSPSFSFFPLLSLLRDIGRLSERVRDREIGRNRKGTKRPNHSLSSHFLLFPSCSFFSFLSFLLIYSFSLPLHRTQTEIKRENRGATERDLERVKQREIAERERTCKTHEDPTNPNEPSDNRRPDPCWVVTDGLEDAISAA